MLNGNSHSRNRASRDAGLELEIPDSLSERLADATAFGWRFAFIQEPDGGFTFVVLDENGRVLQSGVAGSWDDARLRAIEDLFPPSDEDSSS